MSKNSTQSTVNCFQQWLASKDCPKIPKPKKEIEETHSISKLRK